MKLSDSCRRRRFLRELAATAAGLIDRGISPDSEEFVRAMDAVIAKYRKAQEES